MFKFLKSKKGFTLVELMIVVVIMAILVAVAVPIYSAVTANARKKTCAANIREIISQLNNYVMGDGNTFKSVVSFKVTPSSTEGDDPTIEAAGEDALPDGFDEAFIGMFQAVPVCPGGGVYTVTVTAGDGTTTTDSFKVECSAGASATAAKHQVA